MMQQKKKELDEMWAIYNKTKSEAMRERLLEAYIPVIEMISKQIHKRLPRQAIDRQDLVNAGAIGLCQAMEAFDPARKILFRTFCQSRISGAMIDLLREWDWLPRSARVQQKRLNEAKHELITKLKRRPTALEMARAMNMTLEELREFKDSYCVGHLFTLGGDPPDQEWVYGPTYDTHHDIVDNRIGDADAIWDQMKEFIWSQLTFKERELVEDYYFQGKSLKDIAADRGLTESAISFAHSALLNRLARILEPNVTI